MSKIPKAVAAMELLDDPWPERQTAAKDLCEPDVDDDEHDEIENDHGQDHQIEMSIFWTLNQDPTHDQVLLDPFPDPLPALNGGGG